MLKAPSHYAPDRNPLDAGQRARIVVDAMLDAGFITHEQAEAAYRSPVRIGASQFAGAPFFVDYAIAEAKTLAKSIDADLTVRTTYDPALQDALEKIEKYDIRPPDCRLRTANFSGGNQQKIVLAREMEQDPSVLIVAQPTRGVDVGAIEFIHRRIIEMRDAGKAVLLVSVELDEIRSLSDRILVMFVGRVVGERGPEATEGELGLLMAGIEKEEAA